MEIVQAYILHPLTPQPAIGNEPLSECNAVAHKTNRLGDVATMVLDAPSGRIERDHTGMLTDCSPCMSNYTDPLPIHIGLKLRHVAKFASGAM